MELTEYNIILVQNFIQLVFFEVLLPWAKGVKANFRLPIFYDDEVNDKNVPLFKYHKRKLQHRF